MIFLARYGCNDNKMVKPYEHLQSRNEHIIRPASVYRPTKFVVVVVVVVDLG